MSLLPLINKKRLTVLGLNSGTSADGLDMAVVQVTRSGKHVACKFITGKGRPFPKDIARLIETVMHKKPEIDEFLLLHQLVGGFFGRMAAQYLRELSKKGTGVDMIASHGQTVRHLPQGVPFDKHRVRVTFQAGQLEEIAELTGKMTVGDFRQADVAAGGEGAPITGAAMYRLFSDPKKSRMIINIGGIANYFYFRAGSSPAAMQAADCGPGNSLSDLLSRQLFAKPYDQNGALAARGTASKRLLSMFLAHPFYGGKLQSTGREVFGLEMAEEMIQYAKQLGLTREDIIATAAELTAMSIARGIGKIASSDQKLKTIHITGGGRKNKHVMRRLEHYLPGLAIEPIETLGMNGDYVEAACFAVMGEAALRGEQVVVARAKRKSALLHMGKIVLPPSGKKRR